MERKPAQSFKDLLVWQKAHQLVLGIYLSVAANMAEGFKKKGKADKLRFFNIAQGSLSETEYYLILAKDLNYYDANLLMTAISEVGKLLESYMQAIRK